MRVFATIAVIALGLSCTNGDGSKSDKPGTTEQVTPKSDTDGVVVGGVTADSTSTQVLGASANSPIAGASVAFPPGSLPNSADVTVQEGLSLASAGLDTELGVTKGSLSEAGPAVVVTANPATNATTPFNVTLVAKQAAGLLQTSFVVVFKTIDAATGQLVIGIIPTSAITINGTTLVIQTTQFGVFQPLLTSVAITERIEKPTDKPIETPTKPDDGDGGDDGDDSDDKVAPVVEARQGLDTTVPGITQKQAFKFVFSEAIDAAKVDVSGTMKGSGSVTVTASKTKVEGDTITISPKGNWVLGDAKTLSIGVKDVAGNAMAKPVKVTHDVVAKIYYVHPDGQEGGTGTQAAPFSDIGNATEADAAEDGTAYIYVAEGTYYGFELNIGGRVVGGFPDDQWTTRNPKTNVTNVEGDIQANGEPGGGGDDRNVSDELAFADGDTVLDGLNVLVEGPGSAYGVTFSSIQTNVIVRNTIIEVKGGASADGLVFTTGGAPGSLVLTNSRVTGSELVSDNTYQNCTGVQIQDAALVVIDHSTIECTTSSEANTLKAIYLRDSVARIHNNVLSASEATSGNSLGIDFRSSAPDLDVRNNTFWIKSFGSPEAMSVAISEAESSYAKTAAGIRFDNNAVAVINTGTSNVTGVDVDVSDKATDPELEYFTSIRNNAFHMDSPGSMDSDYVFNDYTTVAELEADEGGERSGNIGGTAIDMGFVNAAEGDFSLASDSVLKGAGIDGKAAGWNFDGNFKDLAGAARGTSWSIGAYQ